MEKKNACSIAQLSPLSFALCGQRFAAQSQGAQGPSDTQHYTIGVYRVPLETSPVRSKHDGAILNPWTCQVPVDSKTETSSYVRG